MTTAAAEIMNASETKFARKQAKRDRKWMESLSVAH